MAEILGVVSGGVGIASLAIQLGDSALKLRRFRESYRHAPETLQDTAYEIDTFLLLLQAVGRERERTSGGESDFMHRCVKVCEKSVKRISLTVAKLESVMQRSRRWGKLRTAAEQKELKQLCAELDRATTSLVLAYQVYSE